MKKILLCILLFSATLTGFAQLPEVKGIETKWTTYDGGTTYTICEKSGSYYPDGCKSIEKDTYFGYSFLNMNSYSVTVEAELWITDDNGKTLLDTKSFVLDSKECYVWKRESTYKWRVYIDYPIEYKNDEAQQKRIKVEGNYYVIFKAYKIE